MGVVKFYEDLIESKLLSLHTAFAAQVIKTDGKVATIQPLQKIKQYGKEAEKMAVIEQVPILQNVKKFDYEECNCAVEVKKEILQKEKRKHILIKEIEKGDIVFCICAERDITGAKQAEFTQYEGHHELKNAVIVGVF